MMPWIYVQRSTTVYHNITPQNRWYCNTQHAVYHVCVPILCDIQCTMVVCLYCATYSVPKSTDHSRRILQCTQYIISVDQFVHHKDKLSQKYGPEHVLLCTTGYSEESGGSWEPSRCPSSLVVSQTGTLKPTLNPARDSSEGTKNVKLAFLGFSKWRAERNRWENSKISRGMNFTERYISQK